jgi:uroporphyrinogen-III decarboxylase
VVRRGWGTTFGNSYRTLGIEHFEEVKLATETFIKAITPGSGYIFGTSHELQPNVPIENVVMIYENS